MCTEACRRGATPQLGGSTMKEHLHRCVLVAGACLLTLVSGSARADLDPVIVDGFGMGRYLRIEPLLHFSYAPLPMSPGMGGGVFIGNPGQRDGQDRDAAAEACPEEKEEQTAGSN